MGLGKGVHHASVGSQGRDGTTTGMKRFVADLRPHATAAPERCGGGNGNHATSNNHYRHLEEEDSSARRGSYVGLVCERSVSEVGTRRGAK